MNLKKSILEVISLILIFSGLFLIIIQPFSTVTSAVIDLSSTRGLINFFIGFLMIIFGIILLNYTATLSLRRGIDLETIVNSVSKKNSVLVFDTCGIINFKEQNRLNELLDATKLGYGKVFIPDSVIKEISRSRYDWGIERDRRIMSKRLNHKQTSTYTNIAMEFLKKTKKARLYDEMFPVLDDISKRLDSLPSNKKYSVLKEIKEEYRGKIPDFDKKLEEIEDHTRANRSGDLQQKYFNMKRALKKHYRPSKADAEVLGYALLKSAEENANSKTKKFIGIISNDNDLKEAIHLMQKTPNIHYPMGEKENLAKYLAYIPPETPDQMSRRVEFSYYN